MSVTNSSTERLLRSVLWQYPQDLSSRAKDAIKDQYEQIRGQGVALEDSTVDTDFVRETVKSHDL